MSKNVQKLQHIYNLYNIIIINTTFKHLKTYFKIEVKFIFKKIVQVFIKMFI